MTGNTDINSLLSDLGPGLWKSINPGYFSASDKLLVCSSHATHTFEKDGEWNAPVRWPMALLVLAVLVAVWFARRSVKARETATARRASVTPTRPHPTRPPT